MAVVKASEELCPHYEVISQNVPHIAYTYHLKAASVRSENVVTSRPEDGYLLDLGPSLQVPEPIAMVEVEYQIYETKLRKEVHHLMAPRATCLVEVQVQAPKDNGFLETFQCLLQVWQVIKR